MYIDKAILLFTVPLIVWPLFDIWSHNTNPECSTANNARTGLMQVANNNYNAYTGGNNIIWQCHRTFINGRQYSKDAAVNTAISVFIVARWLWAVDATESSISLFCGLPRGRTEDVFTKAHFHSEVILHNISFYLIALTD